MASIQHPRIVEFKGFVLEIFAIVMEYLPLGALNIYIQNNPQMPWSERYNCAHDVAEGMAFLHSKFLANGKKKSELYHQDLKTANVLLLRESDVKHQLRAKIADFGLSGKTIYLALRCIYLTFHAYLKKKVIKSHHGPTKTEADDSSINEENPSLLDTNFLSAVVHVGGTRNYQAPELSKSGGNFTKAVSCC